MLDLMSNAEERSTFSHHHTVFTYTFNININLLYHDLFFFKDVP